MIQIGLETYLLVLLCFIITEISTYVDHVPYKTDFTTNDFLITSKIQASL